MLYSVYAIYSYARLWTVFFAIIFMLRALLHRWLYFRHFCCGYNRLRWLFWTIRIYVYADGHHHCCFNDGFCVLHPENDNDSSVYGEKTLSSIKLSANVYRALAVFVERQITVPEKASIRSGLLNVSLQGPWGPRNRMITEWGDSSKIDRLTKRRDETIGFKFTVVYRRCGACVCPWRRWSWSFGSKNTAMRPR